MISAFSSLMPAVLPLYGLGAHWVHPLDLEGEGFG